MPQIWLPVSHNEKRVDILIPFVQDIDEGQLNEIIAWQKEKTIEELKKTPPKPKAKMSREEIGGMLNEFHQFMKRKKNDDTKRFY